MSTVNRLLVLLSCTTVAITIERASPSTRVLLPPHGFLHLHEVLQIGLITAFSVLISAAILWTVSREFTELRGRRGLAIAGLFLLGAYFYASGNAAHEVASFFLSHACHGTTSTQTCGGLYIDDYFFGNVLYFIGLGLSSLAVVLVEVRRQSPDATRRDMTITLVNAAVLALTFIAYDAFDRVAVGLVSTIVFAVMFGTLLFASGRRFSQVPFTLYSAVGFVATAVIALPVRLLT